MTDQNPTLTIEEELLVDDLSKRAISELTLGEKEVHILLERSIERIQTMARERAYWEFKASCYAKDIARLKEEIERITNDSTN